MAAIERSTEPNQGSASTSRIADTGQEWASLGKGSEHLTVQITNLRAGQVFKAWSTLRYIDWVAFVLARPEPCEPVPLGYL